jgi:hypothetical protein
MRHLFPSLWLLFFTACASYKVPTETLVQSCPHKEITLEEQQASSHWLYHAIPRHRCQIRWFDVGHWCSWMLLGNDDDGLFGEASHKKHRSDQRIGATRALTWGMRNPLHNFCHYVIGQPRGKKSEFVLLSLSRKKSAVFSYTPESSGVFPQEDSCLHIAFHGIRPFVGLRLKLSPRRRGDFYLGWRERGNFGVKCQPLKKVSS